MLLIIMRYDKQFIYAAPFLLNTSFVPNITKPGYRACFGSSYTKPGYRKVNKNIGNFIDYNLVNIGFIGYSLIKKKIN